MYKNDKRVVMTLDAGGTNFVFSAMQGGRVIVPPVSEKAVSDDLEGCLGVLVDGFRKIYASLPAAPDAISFAFPGPADYRHGVIGHLPNFPAFAGGGVPLGPYLEDVFNLPVFINNDGNLFAYGEALCGKLPEINSMLALRGGSRVYRNLIGITLGTGFGAGVVVNGVLLDGDNGCGGDVWCMQNSIYPERIAEESVSIRAVKRVYGELSGTDASSLTPKDIYDIAEGTVPGDRKAAVESFSEFGRAAGNAIVHALDIVDGLVVVGGGVSGASKYIFPGILGEMRRSLTTFAGASFPCLQAQVYDLTCADGLEAFLKDETPMVEVPGSGRKVPYAKEKKTGIALSTAGANEAIALGAYAFALSRLDLQSQPRTEI